MLQPARFPGRCLAIDVGSHKLAGCRSRRTPRRHTLSPALRYSATFHQVFARAFSDGQIRRTAVRNISLVIGPTPCACSLGTTSVPTHCLHAMTCQRRIDTSGQQDPDSNLAHLANATCIGENRRSRVRALHRVFHPFSSTGAVAPATSSFRDRAVSPQERKTVATLLDEE